MDIPIICNISLIYSCSAAMVTKKIVRGVNYNVLEGKESKMMPRSTH